MMFIVKKCLRLLPHILPLCTFQNTYLVKIFDKYIEIHHFHNILVMMKTFIQKYLRSTNY